MEDTLTQFDSYTTTMFFALFQLVVISLILERALFIIFDVKLWREKLTSTAKALLTAAISIGICFYYDFDLFARLMEMSGRATPTGMVLTGLVISGGSAGARRLTQDFLKLSRQHRDEYKKQFTGP